MKMEKFFNVYICTWKYNWKCLASENNEYAIENVPVKQYGQTAQTALNIIDSFLCFWILEEGPSLVPGIDICGKVL